MTATFRKLRVCERFGRPPEWFDALPPGQAELLLAYEGVRERQEAAVPRI